MATSNIEFPRVVTVYENREKALAKLDSIKFTYGMPACIRHYSEGSTRMLLAVGTGDGIGRYQLMNVSKIDSSYYYVVKNNKSESDEDAIDRATIGKDLSTGDIIQVITQKDGKTINTATYIFSGLRWEPLVKVIESSKVIVEECSLGSNLPLNVVINELIRLAGEGQVSWSNSSDFIITDNITPEGLKERIMHLRLHSPGVGEAGNAICRKEGGLYVEDKGEEINYLHNKIKEVQETISNIQNKWNVDNESLVYDKTSNTYKVGKVDGGII